MKFFTRPVDKSQKNTISKDLEILKNNVLKAADKETPLLKCLESNRTESRLITYSFSKKSRSKKMLINYELAGRNGKEGLLGMLNGKKVASGCIIIPADKEEELEIFLNRHELEYSTQKIMLL